MDYEKKYNEALKWMRELYPGLHGATKEDAEHFFPELRESEDERIRKEIIAFLKHYHTGEGDSVTYDNDWLVYLEKQKEQKPAEWSEDDNNMWTHLNGYLNGFSCSEDAIKQMADWFYELPDRFNLQPKQEWSEEDEKKIHFLSRLIEFQVNDGEYCFGGNSAVSKQEAIEILKSLRPSWKPSEEQMDALKELIDDAHRDGWVTPGATELYEDLKRL